MAKASRFAPEIIEKYINGKWWDKRALCDFWDKNAIDYPDEECLVCSDTRLTWVQAKQWIDRLALGLLELGIEKDDMLVIQLPNTAELFTLRVACEKTSILCLPVMTAFRHKEMEYILKHVDAVGLVIPWVFRDFDYFRMFQDLKPKLPELRHIFVSGKKIPEGVVSVNEIIERPIERHYPPDYLEGKKCPAAEFSLVLPTSGSTGFPKFVEYPSCTQLAAGRNKIRLLDLTREDIFGAFAPGTGPNIPIIYGAPQIGAKVVMLEKFEAGEALKLIEREKITIAFVVPAMLARMLNHPDLSQFDLTSLRLIYSAGAVLNYELGLEAEKKIGCPVVNFYGSVDGGAATGHYWKEPLEVRLASVGKPVGGNELKIVDEKGLDLPDGEQGEILARGPSFVSGYLKDAEATEKVWTEDGWYRTGDLGRIDENGDLVIVGRKTDAIIRGGQNIYPVEIEEILASHPKVSEIAIVGMPDPVLGERACAYVVPARGEKITFEDMISFLMGRNMAKYKLPERLELIDQLPIVAEAQKVDKKILKQDIARKLEKEGR